MRDDVERWNQKYRNGNPNPDFDPDPILKSHADLLDGTGTALDLACGVGHNAMYLAGRGYDVIAIDGSVTGLHYCREAIRGKNLRINLIAADLEQVALPQNYFDVVVVVRYLYRPLIVQIKSAIKPGGLVIYKTFNTNHLRDRADFKKEYLLELGEMKTWFADFHSIATNDSPQLKENLTYYIGRKPSSSR